MEPLDIDTMQSGEPDTMNHGDIDMIDPDDPLLIAQSLTYVTDNGSVLLSYSTAPVTACTFAFPVFGRSIGNIYMYIYSTKTSLLYISMYYSSKPFDSKYL